MCIRDRKQEARCKPIAECARELANVAAMPATASPDSIPLYRPHDEAPASAALRPTDFDGAWADLAGQHLEFVSRGDFVSGSVHLPQAPAAPLLILLHSTGSSANSEELDFGTDAVRAGYAVARIDLPLHGHRASPKLSERLFEGYRALVRGEVLDADSGALLQEFARQSTSDVSRCAEALAALPQVDADQIAFAGHGIGAAAAIWAAPITTGLRAMVITGEVGPMPHGAELDPAGLLEAEAAWGTKRPLLLAIESGDTQENKRVSALAQSAPGSFRLADDNTTPLNSAIDNDETGRRGAILAFLDEALNKG